MPLLSSVRASYGPLRSRNLSFNSGSGGTLTTVPNYNGTSETWNVHTFTSNAAFTVTNSAQPFRYVITGGGAGGPSEFGSQGNGGAVSVSTAWTPAVTSFNAVIGGGAGGCCRPGDWQSSCSSNAGGGSSFAGVSVGGGSVGSGGSNVSNNISGSAVTYGGGAGSGTRGGAGPRGVECGGSGTGGVVVVAYRTI
jgi:hypothetical protein